MKRSVVNRMRTRSAGIIAGATLAGLVFGGGLAAWASGEPVSEKGDAPSIVLDNMIRPTAPPEAGEDVIIGPWESGKTPPDLTPVLLEDGREGYLRVYDMANASPEEQKTRQVNENTLEILLPVYANDGQTVIGEFVAGTVTEE